MSSGVAIAVLAGKIVLEGLSTWNTERKRAFLKKHRKAITKVKKEENNYYPNFNDARLGLSRQALNVMQTEIRVMMEDYLKEREVNEVDN